MVPSHKSDSTTYYGIINCTVQPLIKLCELNESLFFQHYEFLSEDSIALPSAVDLVSVVVISINCRFCSLSLSYK